MLRVGIAGYGTVGRIRHRCIDTVTGAMVVATADQAFQDGTGDDGIVRFSEPFSMIDRMALDVLFVALPNHLAAPVTVRALDAGVNVFCEKPPARNLPEFHRVLDAEQRNSCLHLAYGFNHRYHPSIKMALKTVRSKALGELVDLNGIYGKSAIIRYDTGEWRCQRALAGGGILLDQGIHLVDVMRLLVGEFRDIRSVVSNRYWNHDVEDNVYALMRTSHGVPAILQSSATQWRHNFRLDVTLERGAISLTGILSSTRSYGAEKIAILTPTLGSLGEPTIETHTFSTDTSWQEETSDFLSTVLGGAAPTGLSSSEALKTLETVYRIYEADSEWASAYGWDWKT